MFAWPMPVGSSKISQFQWSFMVGAHEGASEKLGTINDKQPRL